MKMDNKLMDEVNELWVDHSVALEHFGRMCVVAAKAGHGFKVRRYLRRGMIGATLATIVVTSCLDLLSETY